MKTEIRLALLCLASAAVPAAAQEAMPQCGAANYDRSLNAFTIVNPARDVVNQQCYLTVYPRDAKPIQAQQSPDSYVVEGRYVIELSGGGGGGGGGASRDQGGGGGGAGAAPSRTVKHLLPGLYKMTIGMGGKGGSPNGGETESGNPTSLTDARTGQLIAGFAGADTWTRHTQPASDGHGGAAAVGGSKGGDGGDSGPRSEEAAQSGGKSQIAGYSGKPGLSGAENGRSVQTGVEERTVQANAGGGGGASVGSGGAGESVRRNDVAGTGNLGGGGGGGRGGLKTADAGGQGGHGFIRLLLSEPVAQTIATEAKILVQAPPASATVDRKYSLSADALFGFGKPTLNSAGGAQLDELISQLRRVSIDSIVATGHSDRIGSADANQKISEGRAEAVKAYLVSKGIEASRISVEGKGSSQPAAGAFDCKGAATPKVIACLQPNRRVDIEVKGSYKVVGMNSSPDAR